MTRATSRTLLLVFILSPFAAAGGCSDDDDTGGDSATDGDTLGDSDTAGGCDPGLLPGVWLSANYSVEFAADLSYEAAGAPNLLRIDVTGQAVVDGCRISFTNEGGSHPCPVDQIGVYTYSATATTLSFGLVSDLCDGRRIPLDGTILTRE